MLKSPSCLCLNAGDPPLLTYYLQEKLGITIKRKKKQDVGKLPLKVSTDAKWKVGCVLHGPPDFTIWKLNSSVFWGCCVFWHFCTAGGRKNPKGVKEATGDGCTSSCSGWEKWAAWGENTRIWREEQRSRPPPWEYWALLSHSGMNMWFY